MKKIEFSKIIVIWAMAFVTLMSIILTIGFFVTGYTSSELINIVISIGVAVIVSYSTKATVENYNKIKNKENNNTESGGLIGH